MKIADKETFDLLERVAAKRCGALKQMNHKTEKFQKERRRKLLSGGEGVTDDCKSSVLSR